MPTCSCGACPVAPDSPAPFTNTASAVGRYNCSALCFGDVTAQSQPVVIQVLDVTVTKTVSVACASPGDTVSYTILVHNGSSLPITEVLVTDPGIECLLNVVSVTYNGLPVCDASLSDGILIPGIGAGSCAVIAFEAVVPAGTSGPIANTACAAFDFAALPCCTQHMTVASNEAVLNVVAPALTVEKTADRCAVTAEENIITFTLTVTNTGTCPMDTVIVTDMLPAGLTYVAGSTSVNGDAETDLDPAAGITLGALESGDAFTITFRATAAF